MFRCNYLRNEKLFLNFFLAFCEFIFTFKHFKKKMILIVDVFSNVGTPKNVVR